MPRAKIIGSGIFLPPFPVTNQTIADFFPKPPSEKWTPKWVEHKLGIKTRMNSFDFNLGRMRSGYYDIDNALRAALNALEDAGLNSWDIDRVLYATSTPEYLMPDPACLLHMRLGLRSDCSAISATAVGCGGFIYIMDIADSEIRSGKYRTVLLIGSVSVGPYLYAICTNPDLRERDEHLRQNLINAYIFGEGSGALILQASDDEEEVGILSIYTGADGRDNPVIFEAGGSRNPATHQTVSMGMHRFNMNVELVRHKGLRLFEYSVKKIIERFGIGTDKIDCFILHQVNLRLLKEISTQLNIPWEKVIVHVDHYGNLDTATLPVAFHEAKQQGRIKNGSLVLFAAVGAGWQYGAAIARI